MPEYRILWVGDPWEKLDHYWDTTLRLARASIQRGSVNYWCTFRDVSWKDGAVMYRCRRMLHGPDGVFLDAEQQLLRSEFSIFMMRVDPPITDGYRCAIQLMTMDLENQGRDPEKCLINPPSVLLGHSDKSLALLPGACNAESMISADMDELIEFIGRIGAAVVKPVYDHQGRGVSLIEDLSNCRSTLGALMAGGSMHVVAQRFLPLHRDREKRVWMLDGEVVAACLKQFDGAGFPPQFLSERYIASAWLNPKEIETLTRVGRELRRRNVRLAGLDVIDGCVTDINVVSPGLIVELEDLYSIDLSGQIMASLAPALEV